MFFASMLLRYFDEEVKFGMGDVSAESLFRAPAKL